MISYRTASSSCCASRLSSAWRRSPWRLYVQTFTLTCHSRPSRAKSADGIGRLRRVTARDAEDLAARMLGESGRMVAQESDERGNRTLPLASPQLLAHGVHDLLAVPVLPVSDPLPKGPLCAWVALDGVALSAQDRQRGAHHQHRIACGAQTVLAVFRDRLIVAGDAVAARDAEVQLVVLARRQARVEPADLTHDRRTKHHGPRHPD